MALGLAAAGVRVLATAARQSVEVEAVAAEDQNGGIVPVVADVTREDDCDRVVAMAQDRFGRLDILVNNAGRGMRYVSERFLTEPSRFWETDPDVWRMVIDTNNALTSLSRAATLVAYMSLLADCRCKAQPQAWRRTVSEFGSGQTRGSVESVVITATDCPCCPAD